VKSRGLIASLVVVALLVAASITGFFTNTRPLLGLDLEGGLSVVLQAPDNTDKGVMEKALDRIRERVDALGVSEPDIILVGGNIIQVQLHGLGFQGKVT
jgi:preprotein translocase subunit SecD